MSRSVRDTAAVYDYLSRVPNGGSFIKMGAPAGSYLDAIAREPGKLKVGLSTARWGRGDRHGSRGRRRACARSARLLESLGHAVEELNDDAICDWETMWWTYATQWISSRSLFTTMAADKGIPTSDLPKLLNPMTLAALRGRRPLRQVRHLPHDERQQHGDPTVRRADGAL